MALRIPEECGDCTAESCVCRECQGDQAPYCLDIDDNPCTFDGTLSCKWYQQHQVRKEASNVVG
jgi:hypothetical protein